MVSNKDKIFGKILPTQKDFSGEVLILLENKNQVKDCLSWLDEIKGKKQIVALTPFAMYGLDKRGLNYIIADDYYDQEELFKLGIDNFKKVEDISPI